MLGEPIANRGDGSFVCGWSRVWPVKDSHFTEQNHCDAAPFSFADVGSQFAEETFDVSPRDVAAGWSSEKGGQRLLMFLPHWPMVLLHSTTDKTEPST